MDAKPAPNLANETQSSREPGGRSLKLLLALFCILLLFYKLGQPALFEPDEGRNAEVAREILLSKDWVTPQYNFVPRLDKPVFAYWLMALSYKAFGVSEWSARLPSVLSSLGSVFLTYKLAGTFFGLDAGLWSGLVLATNLEHFILSRTVIADNVLAFFITLSLCAFVWAARAESRRWRTFFWFLMYAAMAGGTLVKGPIGALLGAAIIFAHLLLTKNWVVLKECHPLLGSLFYLILVAPWYANVELRNPGYLHYFFVEEHLLRFFTSDFNRNAPWYAYLGILAVGFLPWTPLIPAIVKRAGQDLFGRRKRVFLLLWVAIPFVLFSLSSSKLPHYILPVYPPLSILLGESLGVFGKEFSRGRRWALSSPWLVVISCVLTLVIVSSWPAVLPERIRGAFQESSTGISRTFLFLMGVMAILLVRTFWTSLSARWTFAHYILTCLGFVPIFFSVVEIANQVSFFRSSKVIAEKSSRVVSDDAQIVLYRAYLSSLPFYLRITRPIWVVWSGQGRSVMGSFYVAQKQPRPTMGFEKALFLPEEFCNEWNKSSRKFLVFIHERDLHELSERCGVLPGVVVREGDVVLVTNR